MCIRVGSLHIRMCSYLSACGWFLFQRQYFSSTSISLVFIHSGVPAVQQCGQPMTGAHSILICQNVTGSGQEGKEKGIKFGWKERNDTQSMPACPVVRVHTYTPAQKHTWSPSLNQSMSTWGTGRLPFISPQTSPHSLLSHTTVCSTS